MNRRFSERLSGGFRAGTLPALVMAASVAVAGCSGIGDGTLPVSAVLLPFGGVEGATTSKAFTCINTGISMIIDFSDGARGDFTSRATYTSSNPAVAKVSNRDVEVPEQPNAFYATGTVIPIAPGTTTITAQYLTFTRSIDVTVVAPTNFRVVPSEADLAANSRLDLAAFANLDGIDTTLDSLVSWSFVTPNTAVATIDATAGTVTGVTAGGGLTARARIPGCGMTADAPVTVANLQSLALSREFGDNDKLVLETTELLKATGTLDNGKTQDLSMQVAYTSSDATAVTTFTGALVNLAAAIKAVEVPVQISATFANPAIVAAPISITPIAASLNSIAVTPATVTVAPGGVTQLRSIGTYASGITQDITRHVIWSSSDTAVATVQSATALGLSGASGLTTAMVGSAGRQATITATTTNAAQQTITATSAVTVQ